MNFANDLLLLERKKLPESLLKVKKNKHEQFRNFQQNDFI